MQSLAVRGVRDECDRRRAIQGAVGPDPEAPASPGRSPRAGARESPGARTRARTAWFLYRGYVHQPALAFLMIGLGEPAHGHSLEGQMAWRSLVRAG